MEGISIKDIIQAVHGQLLYGDGQGEIKHISLDSQRLAGGDLFVPIIGQRVDAHRFICPALSSGARAVFTSRHTTKEQVEEEIRRWKEQGTDPGQGAWIAVEDTRKALQDLGAWKRRQISIPLVGVTGSVGKTTTREMIAQALSAQYQVYKTPGNANSQVGVPITICSIPPQAQIGVIELGMSMPGEMERIARVAQVDGAVITNIGDAHIQQLGSRENICKEKLCIQEGMNPQGTLFLNGDDPLLRQVRLEGRKIVFYGQAPFCSYRAENLHLEDGHPVFTAVHGDEQAQVRLAVYGSHMAEDAMAALAVAGEYQIPLQKAADALAAYKGSQGRQQVYRLGQVTMIDDSYNASPVSMKAGIEVLSSMKARRRIAVLADMKELGDEEKELHRQVGRFLAEEPVDLTVLLGDLAEEIKEGMKEAGSKMETISFQNLEDLIQWLPQEIKEGDCILFKGSNSMGLGTAVKAMLERLKSDRI